MEKHGWREDEKFSYYYHRNRLLISLQNYDTNSFLIRFTIDGCEKSRIRCKAHTIPEAQAIAIVCYKRHLNNLMTELPA
jgi:hypothetical protein